MSSAALTRWAKEGTRVAVCGRNADILNKAKDSIASSLESQTRQEGVYFAFDPVAVEGNDRHPVHALKIRGYHLHSYLWLKVGWELAGFLGGFQPLDKSAPERRHVSQKVLAELLYFEHVATHAARHEA